MQQQTTPGRAAGLGWWPCSGIGTEAVVDRRVRGAQGQGGGAAQQHAMEEQVLLRVLRAAAPKDRFEVGLRRPVPASRDAADRRR